MQEPHDSTGDLLMSAARMLRRRFSAALEEYDVTPSQSRALRTVAQEPGVRLSVIAERLRIAPRSATDVVDALERRGLVVRQSDPGDRRATCVAPTAEGIRLRTLIEAARHRELDGFAAKLAQGDRAELDRLLRLIVADLSEDRLSSGSPGNVGGSGGSSGSSGSAGSGGALPGGGSAH